MKTKIRFFLVIIASLIVTNGFSQTYLTNGQVYDFNVGDIIQAREAGGIYSATSAPTYETKIILSKTYSKYKDTIVYSVKRENYTLKNCTDCDPVTSTDTISLTITDLAGAVKMDNQSSCGFRDTIYKDFGNLLVWESLIKQDTSCHAFEPVAHTVQYIQGVGGPFYTKFDPTGPAYNEYKLVYYKNSTGSWGTFFTPEKKPSIFKDYTWNDMEIQRTTCLTARCVGGARYTTHSYHLGKDTLLNLENYNALIDTFYATNYQQGDTIGFIRQEMDGKKIYFLPKYPDKEFLLYDFTLKPGDEFSFSKYWNPVVYKVTRADSVDYLGVKRLTITLSNAYEESMVWIEGVGSAQGLMYCNYYESMLLCVTDHQNLIYKNTRGYDCLETSIIDGINDTEATNTLRVYPNPASDYIHVQSNEIIKTVEIFDVNGNKIYEDHPHSQASQISLLNYKRGIYFMEINCQSVKFIIK